MPPTVTAENVDLYGIDNVRTHYRVYMSDECMGIAVSIQNTQVFTPQFSP